MSQVLMEDDLLCGDLALLVANDLSTEYCMELQTHVINIIKRDEIIMSSGFAFTPINQMRIL